MIERGILAHFIASLDGLYERSTGTRWLQFASVDVLEISNPLTHGGHLIIAPEAVRTDAEALFAFLQAHEISHAFLPPSILKLLPRRPLPDLTAVLRGGEASDNDTIRFRRWFSELAKSGLSVLPETPLEWQQRLTGLSPSNGLALIRDFYTGDLSGTPQPIDQIGTKAELTKQDVHLTDNYDRLIPLYLDYLRAQGFIDETAATPAVL